MAHDDWVIQIFVLRALSRSRRAAAADSGSSARRRAAAAFRAQPGAAWNWNVPTVILHYVTPEIVKNTDVQKMPRCHPS